MLLMFNPNERHTYQVMRTNKNGSVHVKIKQKSYVWFGWFNCWADFVKAYPNAFSA